MLDEGNRKALAIEANYSRPSAHVVELLDELMAHHGAPRRLRCDIGPEFIAEALQAWCAARGVTLAFIEPGKLNQNAYSERFNCTIR